MTKRQEQKNDAATEVQKTGLLDNIPKWEPPRVPTDWWPKDPAVTAGVPSAYPENTIVGAKEQAGTDNNNQIDNYYHAADAWIRSVEAGKQPATGFPLVPAATGVVFNGELYVPFPGVGTPVCERIEPRDYLTPRQ